MSDDSGKPLVLVTEGGDREAVEWMRGQVRVVEVAHTDPRFEELLPEAEGLSVRTYTRVNQGMIDRAKKLRVVGRGGVGLENIDVGACRRRGIEVVYTPDANTLAVGDFVFGYLTRMLRPWYFMTDKAYAPEEFKRIRNSVRGRQLNELTIGILGMGRVGKLVGRIAAAGFGMKVLYNDIVDVRPETLGYPATPVDKERLYRESDVLTIHVTMLQGNENLVGREQIARMKRDAILINTSRGEVLDAGALADAIKEKRLAGAAVDVYWPEPPGQDLPLLGLPNVLLTPHLASRTETAQKNMSWVVRDVVAVLRGERPRFPAP